MLTIKITKKDGTVVENTVDAEGNTDGGNKK